MSQQREPDNMWDGCEQYKEEWKHIHAPAELVALTKEKAAMEEEKQRRRKMYRRRYLPAAAAVFAVVLLSFPLWKRETGTKSQIPLPPYLGSTEEAPKPEEEVVLQQMTVLPMEFLQENAWTEELEGVPVKWVQKDGSYIAAFADEKGYTVVSMKTEDWEVLKEQVRLLLQDGGNVNENRK